MKKEEEKILVKNEDIVLYKTTEGEWQQNSTVKDYLTVQKEGEREVQRIVSYYNLDMIISVGYRVKSRRSVEFRIWATKTLRGFLKISPRHSCESRNLLKFRRLRVKPAMTK